MNANITKLTDLIWIGGDTDPDQSVAAKQIDDILNRTNIVTVLDLRLEWNDMPLWNKCDPTGRAYYKWLGTDDDGMDLSPEWWEMALDFLHHQLLVHERPTLIHCHMGVNRAPSLAGLAMVALHGWEPIPAWWAIREARPMAWAYYLPNGYRWLAEEDNYYLWAKTTKATPEDLLYAADVIDEHLRTNASSIRHVIRTIRKMERERAIVNQSSVTKNM